MADLSIFSKRLKEARRAAELSQSELAKLAGTTSATVSAYESASGIKKPSLDLAMSFSTALNVSIDWLCGKEDNVTASNGVVDFDCKTYLRSLVRVITEMSTETYIGGFGGATASISITQSSLSDFMSKIKDLLKVYRAGSLSEDLYVTCVEKIINDYSEDHLYEYDNFLLDDESLDAYNYLTNIAHDISSGIITASLAAPYDQSSRKVDLFVSDRKLEWLRKV